MIHRVAPLLLLVATLHPPIAAAQTPAAPMHPTTHLILHLDLGSSIAENLRTHRITGLQISASNRNRDQVDLDATNATTVATDVAPGKWKVRTLLRMSRELFVLDPAGIDIDVPPIAEYETTIPVHSFIISGRVKTPAGEPFRGHQMNFWPSLRSTTNWGIAIPLDNEGRFVFPLPYAGAWDFNVFGDTPGDFAGEVTDVPISEADTARELTFTLPAAAIAGKVVDASDKGVAGVRVHASLARSDDHRKIDRRVTSDAEGRFHIDNLPAGDWTLDVAQKDGSTKEQHVAVKDGGRQDGVVLKLRTAPAPAATSSSH